MAFILATTAITFHFKSTIQTFSVLSDMSRVAVLDWDFWKWQHLLQIKVKLFTVFKFTFHMHIKGSCKQLVNGFLYNDFCFLTQASIPFDFISLKSAKILAFHMVEEN